MFQCIKRFAQINYLHASNTYWVLSIIKPFILTFIKSHSSGSFHLAYMYRSCASNLRLINCLLSEQHNRRMFDLCTVIICYPSWDSKSILEGSRYSNLHWYRDALLVSLKMDVSVLDSCPSSGVLRWDLLPWRWIFQSKTSVLFSGFLSSFLRSCIPQWRAASAKTFSPHSVWCDAFFMNRDLLFIFWSEDNVAEPSLSSLKTPKLYITKKINQ